MLSVPECPHVRLLEDRLRRAVTGLAGVSMSRKVIATADDAARAGMRGSPTVLVDGIDPFAEPRVPTGLSCRLYRQPDGTIEGAPSVDRLRAALQAPAGQACQ